MKKLQDIINNGFYLAWVAIGLSAIAGRTIEIITYSEFKGAALVAGGLLCAAYAIEKITAK